MQDIYNNDTVNKTSIHHRLLSKNNFGKIAELLTDIQLHYEQINENEAKIFKILLRVRNDTCTI